MKKRALSTILALTLCLSTLFAGAASALAPGDIDGDKKITSSDARLALRAAVALDTLSAEKEKAADVDYDGKVTSSDARIILRCSVGLEAIEIKAPISTENSTKVTLNGSEITVPAFNEIVNVLKTTQNGVNYFTGFDEDIINTDKAEISGALAGIMDDGTNVATTETTYSGIDYRLLTPSNFHTLGAKYVSDLTDKDIQSIYISVVDSVEFIDTLPDNYTVGKTAYDLTPVKNAEFPEVYKITLTLNPEAVDINTPVTAKSVYDKIYLSDYNNKVEEMRKDLITEIDSIKEVMLLTQASGSITSNLTIEYYVTTDTFTPIAAKYENSFNCSLSIKVPAMISIKQNVYMASNSYYFFNNDFNAYK